MASLFGTAVLSVTALFFLSTSWSSFSKPREFGERLGFTIAGADGVNEIRAQYGGFFLAAAVCGVAALGGLIPRSTGFLVNGTIFGGLIAGRLVSLLMDRGIRKYGALIRALFVIDALGFALAIIALVLERSR
jgi:energy-converting hydrogenase Eha subunit B